MAINNAPDQDFQKLLQAMQEQSEQVADYLAGGETGRPWMLPPLRDWSGDPNDVAGIKKAFARDAQNSDYADALFTGGTMADCAGAHLQISYLSIMERAFRARHMTPTRAAMHAAGRRKGHGSPAGIHVGSVVQYIQDVLKSGTPDINPNNA